MQSIKPKIHHIQFFSKHAYPGKIPACNQTWNKQFWCFFNTKQPHQPNRMTLDKQIRQVKILQNLQKSANIPIIIKLYFRMKFDR